MGLVSNGRRGVFVFDRGRIRDFFQSVGKIEFMIDELMREMRLARAVVEASLIMWAKTPSMTEALDVERFIACRTSA